MRLVDADAVKEALRNRISENIDECINNVPTVDVLDKIRAEIANHCGVNTDYCDSCRFCTDSIGVREILQIIDKYKAERSE